MEYRDQVYFEFQPETEICFSRGEYARRLNEIRKRMAEDDIDCLLVTSPESMNYVNGFICMWYQTESPFEWPPGNGIAIHVDHDRFIHFETEREAVVSRIFTVSEDTRFFPKSSYRDGSQFIADELKAEGWLKGTVGIEQWAMRPNRIVSERLQSNFETAGAKVVDASHIIRDVRWLKSEEEMDCMEEAARIAGAGLEAASKVIRPGVTELEVQGEVIRALTAAGGELQAMMLPVLSGGKTHGCHAVSTRRKLQAGETVCIDLAGVRHRYHINAARTFFLGEPPRDVLTTVEKAAAVMDVIAKILRPNLPVRELNEVVKAHYEANQLWDKRGWIGGYEMGISFFSDWVGNFVYDPLSEKNADRVFEPGTAVNHEIQVFLPRFMGQFFMIESFLFKDKTATFATPQVPYGLIVLE